MIGWPGGVVVLDDDPTGTQSAENVDVLLDLDEDYLRAWFAAHSPRPVYVLTNNRALAAGPARQRTAQIASTVLASWPGAQLICRGDSTLRGHVGPEFEAVSDRTGAQVLVLVPAMPSAGRVTRGGIHYLDAGTRLVPLAETEYASDADFGYTHSSLLDWAEDRSAGQFPAADGAVVPLDRLRRDGRAAVAEVLGRLDRAGQPAACACDAETDADLVLIADGIRLAWDLGVRLVVRCAPPLAAMLAGRHAQARHCPPRSVDRLLAVVGSYVQASSGQLAEIRRRHPDRVVEASIEALLADPDGESTRLARALAGLWQTGPLAVLATSRGRPRPGTPGLPVARALADAVAWLPEPAAAVVTRGGITSAVTASRGLGARSAWTVGPVATGIAMWRLGQERETPLLIAAGNIGGPCDLADLLDEMTA